jgi:nucleotide-binding universal stress UspA family protein
VTILVAVSRAHTRDKVLDVAVRFGEAFDRELYIVHLAEVETDTNDPSEIREELRQQVLEENVVATVAVESVEPTLARAGAHLGEQLLALAADVDISHIVVGHRSKGVIEDLTQGNTAFTVADDASVPVTIVPEGAASSTA